MFALSVIYLSFPVIHGESDEPLGFLLPKPPLWLFILPNIASPHVLAEPKRPDSTISVGNGSPKLLTLASTFITASLAALILVLSMHLRPNMVQITVKPPQRPLVDRDHPVLSPFFLPGGRYLSAEVRAIDVQYRHLAVRDTR